MEATCQNHASYRFQWFGKQDSYICEEHKVKLRSVATSMNLNLIILPLEPHEKEILYCSQKVKITPEPTSQQ